MDISYWAIIAFIVSLYETIFLKVFKLIINYNGLDCLNKYEIIAI